MMRILLKSIAVKQANVVNDGNQLGWLIASRSQTLILRKLQKGLMTLQ